MQKDVYQLHLENSSYPKRQRKTLYRGKKSVFTFKKGSSKLSSLQFASLVATVVMVMTFIGLALMRRQNPSLSEPNPAVSAIPKPQESLSSVQVFPLPQATSPIDISPQMKQESSELVYNVKIAPNFKKSDALQSIVDDAVALAAVKGLPKNPLSITLIDAKTGKYAQYQQEKPRFPASVVKMFWMVYLYAQIEKGLWNETDFIPSLNAMIKKSDNNAGSDILDAITQTESGKNLEGKEYDKWLLNRKKINNFFQQAGYEKINVSQKAFPITNKKIYEPQGSDLKMRGDLKNPIRNKITTQQAARLLYEIYDGQSISQVYSEKMANWLSIDSATRIEKREQQNPNEFNPVRGYLSESLPTDVYFGGKAGWTSGSRQEAAYIATPDGKAAYILVIFADDRTYAYDWKIFPQMSRFVYDRMTNRK